MTSRIMRTKIFRRGFDWVMTAHDSVVGPIGAEDPAIVMATCQCDECRRMREPQSRVEK